MIRREILDGVSLVCNHHIGSWKIHLERLSSSQLSSNVRRNRDFQKIRIRKWVQARMVSLTG